MVRLLLILGIVSWQSFASEWLLAQHPSASLSAVDLKFSDHKVVRLGGVGLPNAIEILPGIISGGQPQGPLAFDELAKMGIKTIISVDAIKPKVDQAKRLGMRYVHLPHGYDGIPADRMLEIAKAIDSLPGPIYIHCHRGKHRSPAATVGACVALGKIPAGDAQALLRFAGTSRQYSGLYRSAMQQVVIDAQQLADVPVDFPSVAQVPALAQTMVELDECFSNLLQLQDHSWQTIDQHPDLKAVHQALLLTEVYSELLRPERLRVQHQQRIANQPRNGTQGQSSPAYLAYKELLILGQNQASDLRLTLQKIESINSKADLRDPAEGANGGISLAKGQAIDQAIDQANRLMAGLKQNCTSCHERFRDNPNPK